MIHITVPDMNDSVSDIKIDGVSYKIRFTYNSRYDYWSFGLKDSSGNDIISATKIVPNFPIFYFYSDDRIPDGAFGAYTTLKRIGRNDFKEDKADFVYVTNSEVENGD